MPHSATSAIALTARAMRLILLALLPALASASYDVFGASITGPLDETSCNIEVVEEANSDHLHGLLDELTATTFFRLINVNMDGRCPYWGASPEEDDEPACESKAEDTAVPLCTLGTDGGGDNPFGAPPSPFSPFASSIPEPTTDWVDHTTTPEEESAAVGYPSAEDCSNEELPTFWLDMCAAIPTNASDYVNLQLNPERYTGYNGSHVWAAIYEENCLLRTAGQEHGACYEERVLLRLFSGMHAATNTHIARYYHAPSKRKNRTEWAPDLGYFARQFDGHPERLKNMHFAFVVLLRAVRRASPFLASYPYAAGAEAEAGEAARTAALVDRLLDTHVLSSCAAVFEGFDETMLFREKQAEWWSLKKQFKGVFHNVSTVLDCVSCQKCRLHAKVTMLGLGTALKMLLVPAELLPTSVTRDEVVALVNTLAKFSTALHYVKELTQMTYAAYFNEARSKSKDEEALPPPPKAAPKTAPPLAPRTTPTTAAPADPSAPTGPVASSDVDLALHRTAELVKAGALSAAEEDAVVGRLLSLDARFLYLAKHFGSLPSFARHLRAALASAPAAAPLAAAAAPRAAAADGPDVVVVGSGVAGMTAALRILDRGGRVTLVEKERRLGGNSAKASSGINGCCPPHSRAERNAADTVDAFAADTAKSAKRDAGGLIALLARSSEGAIEWLRQRTKVDLSKLAQLGGHSYARTHRPANGMIGAELVYALQREVRKFEASGRLSLLTSTRVASLLHEGGAVAGVAYVDAKDGATKELRAPATVLATGGFANDRTNTSLLAKHRPDLLRFATTNGEWATGDGMKMAMAIGAGTVDMDRVQVHPTGFVDAADVGASTKVLCGEMMRGVGGVLLLPDGRRFVNELAPRDVVVAAELESGADEFFIVLNAAAAAEAGKHTELYVRKGLLNKVEGAAGLASYMIDAQAASRRGGAPPPTDAALAAALGATFEAYAAAAAGGGADEFGKTAFHNGAIAAEGTLYVGRIVPVLHYTMGGITMDADGHVLRDDGAPIVGLHAAGEVTGGVHGNNRLGGNSLLECTVFGSIVGERLGKQIEAAKAAAEAEAALPAAGEGKVIEETKADEGAAAAKAARVVTKEELAAHSTHDDCWVALYGRVYDFSAFVDEHPAGPESIVKLAGTDGTEAYETVHNEGMLAEFEGDLIGVLEK